MSKGLKKMANSASAYLNSKRVRKDGMAAIYLRVIIHRKIQYINLDVSWYPSLFFDGECRKFGKVKPDDINLIISDALAKASEIFIQYRLRRIPLSMEAFLREFKTNLNKDDFLVYYKNKMMQRLKEGEIESSSRRSHEVTLNHLRNWKKVLLFSELDDRTAFNFERYLVKKTGSQSMNSRWGQHRNFKTYLNAAKRDNIEFIHPYDYYSAKTCESKFIPLTQDQFRTIWKEYHSRGYVGTERAVVRGFLFCCVTAMRHSDVRRVCLDWVEGDFFDFIPQKTKRHGTRVRVPASKEALILMAEEMNEVGREPMFRSISEQKQNKIMTQIGKKIGFLKTNLCFQIARETFATLYMEMDGKLEVLASLMGHTTTSMTEKYVKIRDQRKREEMERISSFFRKID
jgi:integrase/recombinase XerD